MWTAKFKIWHKTCLIRPLCQKYQVTDFVYLVNSWIEKETFFYTELHILQGKEQDKKKFIKELRKTTKKLEQKGNYIFTLNQKPISKKFYSIAFNPKIIYLKPVAQRTDGYEDWELACWEKQPLMNILKIPEFQTQLKSIQRKKITELFIPQIYPKLPPKQKQALEFAIKKGYYNYPRHIDLQSLAKLSKIKRQTFQEHLHKAEKKLIPFLTEGLN